MTRKTKTPDTFAERLCGIRTVNDLHSRKGSTDYKIVEVTNDPEAQQRILLKPPQKQAAAA